MSLHLNNHSVLPRAEHLPILNYTHNDDPWHRSDNYSRGCFNCPLSLLDPGGKVPGDTPQRSFELPSLRDRDVSWGSSSFIYSLGSWTGTFAHCNLISNFMSLLTASLDYINNSMLLEIQDSLVAQTVKNLSAMQETWVQPLRWEEPLEKEMATHSCILAWRIPWTEDPGGIHSPWDHKGLDTTEWLTFTFIVNTGPISATSYRSHKLCLFYWLINFLKAFLVQRLAPPPLQLSNSFSSVSQRLATPPANERFCSSLCA